MKGARDPAQDRIRGHRAADAQLRFLGRDGRPLANAEVHVRLTSHEFGLGCNAFRIGGIADATPQRAYEERFADLLNFATLPFYWGGYEPEQGKTGEPRLHAMADWCTRHGIATKGHPLVWHEVYPGWGNQFEDTHMIGRLERRVRGIVSDFASAIDIWDVVNEATVSHRFENAVGRWIAEKGAAKCVAEALSWAHEANPEATLLYNDFNLSDDFEALLETLLDAGAPLDAIGIQSHMHKGTWPIEHVWEVCEAYSRFGLPLHFTETTVLSGRLKGPDDNDWHKRRDDWVTTPEGEAQQMEYGAQLYTTLFSHPAVEAITWWDFSDAGAWQGAPAGLVRKDMSPKPLYEWLMVAFHDRWTTDVQVTTDETGCATVPCFFGDYEVEATVGAGGEAKGAFLFARRGPREITVTVGG